VKAYSVWLLEDPAEYYDIVHAETPGKAKSKSWFYGDADWTEFRVKRLPEMDGKAITSINLIEADLPCNCDWLGCYDPVYPGDEGMTIVRDKVYCHRHTKKDIFIAWSPCTCGEYNPYFIILGSECRNCDEDRIASHVV
jgi:hypothetical protein